VREIQPGDLVKLDVVAENRQRLHDGLVIALEPIIAMGTGRAVAAADGWTTRTVDGSLSAHYEHTIVVTRGRPVVLTTIAA
jgi:methionyl aminopeptidase